MTRIANLGEAVHLSAVQKGKERADRFESRLGLLELSLYAVTINNTLRSADFRVIRGQQQLLEVARRTAATLDEGHSVRVFFRGNQVDLGQWNERQLYTIEPLAGSFSVYSLDQEFLEERDLEGVPKTTYSFVVHGRRGADMPPPAKLPGPPDVFSIIERLRADLVRALEENRPKPVIGNYGAGDEQLERVRKVVDESNERARRDVGEVEAKPPLQAPPGKPEPLPGPDHNVEPDPPADPPADVADPKRNEKGAPLDRGAERPKPARPGLDDLDVAPDPEAGGGPTLSVLAVPRPEEAPPGPSARASAVESRPVSRNEVLEALISFTRAALPAAGPVPPFPLRPPGGAVGADRKALQRLAGTKGKGNRLADLYRVVAQLGRDRSRAFAVPGKDPDGSLTWARMLARARFVAPEAAEPGDLVYLADARAPGGRYPAVVVDVERPGVPSTVLARITDEAPYALVSPRTPAAVLSAWRPDPGAVFAAGSGMAGFWGNEPSRSAWGRLLERFAPRTGTAFDFVHALARIARTDEVSVEGLVVAAGAELRVLDATTPRWPGAVLFGSGDRVGVAMADGSVLGTVPPGDVTAGLVHPRRFGARFIWYPSR